MSDTERLEAAAAKLEALADAASPAPWYYNGYNQVFSGPMMRPYDEWLEGIDEAHTLERYKGPCPACGDWSWQPTWQDEPIVGKGCQLQAEDVRRDHQVCRVIPTAGDTAHGRHQGDAALIDAMDPASARAVAALLRMLVDDLDVIDSTTYAAALAVADAVLGVPASPKEQTDA